MLVTESTDQQKIKCDFLNLKKKAGNDSITNPAAATGDSVLKKAVLGADGRWQASKPACYFRSSVSL